MGPYFSPQKIPTMLARLLYKVYHVRFRTLEKLLNKQIILTSFEKITFFRWVFNINNL